MERDQGKGDSVLNTFNVVCNGLKVLKSLSQELLCVGNVEEAHLDALTFVKTATSCLIKILQEIKRSTDLNVIASQIHHIARSLELRLGDPDKPESVSWLSR
jgi:hypothetical protein